MTKVVRIAIILSLAVGLFILAGVVMNTRLRLLNGKRKQHASQEPSDVPSTVPGFVQHYLRDCCGVPDMIVFPSDSLSLYGMGDEEIRDTIAELSVLAGKNTPTPRQVELHRVETVSDLTRLLADLKPKYSQRPQSFDARSA